MRKETPRNKEDCYQKELTKKPNFRTEEQSSQTCLLGSFLQMKVNTAQGVSRTVVSQYKRMTGCKKWTHETCAVYGVK